MHLNPPIDRFLDSRAAERIEALALSAPVINQPDVEPGPEIGGWFCRQIDCVCELDRHPAAAWIAAGMGGPERADGWAPSPDAA